MYKARRVLVVDDEPLIASMLADWLQELGYDVAGPAGNAEEALAIAQQSPVDGALLDVTIEGGDSFALAEALIARGVNVAFVTGRNADSLPARFKSAPVLGKPFDFEAMKALLNVIVGPTNADSADA